MKFLYSLFSAQVFYMSHLAYASSTLNLMIDNQYYEKTTKLSAQIVYRKDKEQEVFEFAKLVPPRTPDSFGSLAVSVPNKRFLSVTLVLSKEDALPDTTVYAIASYTFPSQYISKFTATIKESTIEINSEPNLPPKLGND
ncbi:MAG: hypothetical protein IBJ00_01750 [Alphaproteobacteria bacterium]|nr:hypothetical protein [Alphaproteobacteria bacterium]